MNRSSILTTAVLTLAVLFASETAQGQVLVNCCMSDGTCQSFFGGCPAGSVQTDLFCSNCGCAGNCGGPAAACWCDNACFILGDCCNDICQHCTGPVVAGCSCQGGCPEGPVGQCWCDPNCWVFDDCCLDICDHCTAHYPDQCTTCIGNTCGSAQPVGDGPTDNNGISGCSPSGTSDSCSIADKDRWFAYTASCDGLASAMVCYTDDVFLTFDVALSVFDACPAQGGIELACENEHPNTFCVAPASAHVTWHVEAGETYYVRLTGNGTFATVNFQCRPCSEWFDLGGGVSDGPGFFGSVNALTHYNGELIVGGRFPEAGPGVMVNNIARWNGFQWHSLTSGGETGVSPFLYALTVYDGDLIVGGSFTTAGGQTVNNIARWDGTAWHPFASGGQIGLGNGPVHALTVWNGDLIAGGNFSTAGGQTATHIARWDGTQWHPFISSGGQNGMGLPVNALTVYNGNLIAGGDFTTAGGQVVNRIARWDGTQWHPFSSGGQIGVSGGIGLSQSVHALTVYNGDLIAGGHFTTAGGQTMHHIARWDGTEWHPLTSASAGQIGLGGSDIAAVFALLAYNGNLIAGGSFTTAGGQVVNRIVQWDGTEWYPFLSGGHSGVSGSVRTLIEDNGDLIAGGNFATAGGKQVNRIALWRDCDLLPLCGEPTAGDCFTVNGSPSCNDADCCAAVCEQDSYCCSIDWDGVCVMQAEALCTGPPAGECGSPLSGDCFAVSNTPACKNEACCEAVCKIDGFCCKTAWDQGCVTLAQDICNQPGFSNSGGQAGQFTGQGPHGLFKYQVEYFNGSLASGSLCCGLDTLPQTVFADFVLDIYEGIGTTPGYTAGLENVVSFSLQFGENHWTDLLLFDITFDAIGPTMASDLTWMGARIETDNGWDVPLNFPLTFKGENAAGEPFEILYTDSICELIPTNCNEIGCCEGHCDGVSPVGCACDAGCSSRGDCCSDACATCERTECCPADLTGTGSVGVFDLLALLGVWGPCPDPPALCPADLDSDGNVNVFDLLDLIGQWGPCP